MSLQNYKNKCLSAARQLLKSIALWAGLPACLHPLVLSILRCLACMTYRRSAVERAESARQRLVLVGQGATSFHLVAELRLLLPLMFGLLVIVLGWALTTFGATDDGTMMPSNSSSMHFQVDPADMTTSTTNAMLASTTTDSELDSSYNSLGLLDQKSTDGDVLDKVVTIPSDTTTFSAILASSTDDVFS